MREGKKKKKKKKMKPKKGESHHVWPTRNSNSTKQEVPIKVSATPPSLPSLLRISFVLRRRRQQRQIRIQTPENVGVSYCI
jgi:hypothetical protein